MKSTALTGSLSFAAPDETAEARQAAGVPFLRRVARSRLAQFVVVGGLVFAASSLRNGGSTITLARADLDGRRDAELRKKPLGTRGDIDAAVTERALEDELLYREGLKLGFDRNDGIIRARVVQKTLFLAEELAGASEPATDAELRAFHDSTRSRWVSPERFRLVHLFAHDRAALVAIRDQANAHADEPVAIGTLGEPCPVPRSTTVSRAEAETTFGSDFANALPSLPTEGFSEPVRSSLGWHLVRVVGHEPAAQQSFEEVKSALRGLYTSQRRGAAVSAYLERAFRDYDVTIDGQRVTAIHPAGRVAIRKSGSAED